MTPEELNDREQIVDCIHRYTRGVDRADHELLLSAFHEDAVDYHGDFVGSPHEFVAWLKLQHANRLATQHFVTNHTFEFEGDTAHVETYFMVPIRDGGRTEVELVGGRYADRFERRAGEWKISRRVVIWEWHTSAPALPIPASVGIARRDRGDVSYLRPLEKRP
jgi:hypothetical protein